MQTSHWGLMGPEFLPNSRRSRTLGIGASVRRYNDLAVPGLGGVSFGKQLVLATLGVIVAEQARLKMAKVQNVEVTNAIEAMACWLAFQHNGWQSDWRLRGGTKLQGKTDFTFEKVRQPSFYVTQPMRMATVIALPALGLVESDSGRFNSFRPSAAGFELIHAATAKYRPYNRSFLDHLARWVCHPNEVIQLNTGAVREALSPLSPVGAEVAKCLRERLIHGGQETPADRKRRVDARLWVETLRAAPPSRAPTWTERPAAISPEHWHDLQAGAGFFQLRDAALVLLDAVEAVIGNQSSACSLSLRGKLANDGLQAPLVALRTAADHYRQVVAEQGEADPIALLFAQECSDRDDNKLIRSLVSRDGNVLRVLGDDVKPGPAFQFGQTLAANAEVAQPESPDAETILLPPGISYRVRNLYWLNFEIQGQLDQQLTPQTGAAA